MVHLFQKEPAMKQEKAMTIRLSAEQADALATVATVEERSVVDVIRAAIADHIAVKQKDPVFQEGLRDRIKRATKLLQR